AQLEQALSAIPAHAQGGGQAQQQQQPPAAAPHPSSSGPRFARFNAGGGQGSTSVPAKQPSVIVAGSLGDGGGGISGSLPRNGPPPVDPHSSAAAHDTRA